MRTRLSARGQVVIPKQARETLGWAEGLELDVRVLDDRIVLRRRSDVVDEHPWMKWEGVLVGTDALEDLEREHRDEVEREDEELAEYLRREKPGS